MSPFILNIFYFIDFYTIHNTTILVLFFCLEILKNNLDNVTMELAWKGYIYIYIVHTFISKVTMEILLRRKYLVIIVNC